MMRTLIGALLALTALSPVAASAQEVRTDVRMDRGDQRRGRDGGQDRGIDRGRPDSSRPDSPRIDDRGPVVTGGARADWQGGRDDRDADRRARRDDRPGTNWSAPQRPDRTDDRRAVPDGYANRDDRARRDRNRDPRNDQSRQRRWDQPRADWTRSRLDRRDDRWAQSQFDDRRAWNRGWRSDDRYDWNRYRAVDRSAYRLPRYYAPYGWGGGYRRFGIGVSLQSQLWSQNYWISDPYAYRLPEAYGPYRWVRYYGDALLVDVRYGQVIDAVYGIFG